LRKEGGKRARLPLLAHALIHNGIPPALQTIDLSVTFMISKRILNISEYNYYVILKQK